MTDNLSVAALRARLAAGERFKYLYFWGHQERADSAVGAACLSQWYPAPFVRDGVAYATAEHSMMADKARLFGDQAALARILAAPSPGAVKALGRTIVGFDEAAWAAARFDIVVRANLAKFGAHASLGAFLLASGERVLVEASPLDRIWGIGLAATDARAGDPGQWQGENLLGFALMAVRAALRASKPEPDH